LKFINVGAIKTRIFRETNVSNLNNEDPETTHVLDYVTIICNSLNYKCIGLCDYCL